MRAFVGFTHIYYSVEVEDNIIITYEEYLNKAAVCVWLRTLM